MVKFLKAFLIFVILYHIIVTVICYGIFWGQYQEFFSLLRDGIRIAFIAIVISTHRRHCRQFLKTRKYSLIFLWALLIFGIVISKWMDKSRYDILVGIKYGLRYLIILITAIYIGFSLAYEKNKERFMKFLHFFLYTLIIIMLFGFLRQWAKLIIPEFFHQIGYGPLKDFVFGDKPPIYYLTWYQWTLRWQGIFAWPNNYGYFLIAFLPIIVLFFRQRLTSIKNLFTANKKTILNIAVIALWIIAIILTLSRTAFIGGIIALALLNIQWIKAHKKRARWIWIICILWLIGLSALKWASTIGHIKAKFGSIAYVLDQPGGYGLGTSWPAIHHNGTILPENYYIQLMLDIGTIGFLLWTIVMLQIIRVARKIQKAFKNIQMTANEQTIYLMRKWLSIWRVTLLIMGIFLHVFEDSMVNYLFFITRWILTGYLSTYIKKRD